MSCVGIDIGRFSVKVAEVEATGRDYKILQTKVFPIPQDPNRDYRLEVVEILRAINGVFDPNTTRYIVGVPQTRVTVRRRVFPVKERHQILKSLPFQMEDEIPFSSEDAFFDGKITRYINNTAEVIAVAAPRPVIADILSLCQDGGIEPQILSVSGISLNSLFESLYDSPPQETEEAMAIPEAQAATAVLNLGHSSTEVVVHVGGRIVDARSLDWGGKDIGQDIAKNYNLQLPEALRELTSKGFVLLNDEGATKDQIAFSEVIKGSLQKLAQELNLALIDIQTSNNVKVDEMLLVGGVSLLKNIGPFLTQTVGIRSNRLIEVPAHPTLSFMSGEHQEPLTGVAITLALEGLKRPRNPALNLLKGEFTRQSQNLKVFWEKWGHTVQVASACLVVLLVWGILRESMALSLVEQATERLQTLSQNIPGLRGKKGNLRNAQKYVTEQTQQIKLRQAAQDLVYINSALDIVKNITEITPNKTRVRLNVLRLSVDTEVVTLEGEVERSSALLELQNQLKTIALNGRVQPMNFQGKLTPNWTPFSYQFSVARKSGGKP